MNETNIFSEFKYSNWSYVIIILLLTGLSFVGQVGFIIAMCLMILVLRYQKISLSDIGLNRPKSWGKTILISGIAALLILVLFLLIINPIIQNLLSIDGQNLDRFSLLRGNMTYWIIGMISAVVTAGFGEEIIWRGYVMRHLARLFGGKKGAWLCSLFITSLVFGLLHSYQGIMGILQTGITGLFLGILFIANGKNNLWINIITHSLIDMISLTAIFLGFV